MRHGRFALAFAVTAIFAGLAPSMSRAHSVPTHENITKAAVGWLLEAQPRLQCTDAGRQALTAALLVGTKHEDDDYDDNQALEMGRYMFHFYPPLDDAFAALDIQAPAVGGGWHKLWELDLGIFRANSGCSSLTWGGFESTAPGNVACNYNASRLPPITYGNEFTWGNALEDVRRKVVVTPQSTIVTGSKDQKRVNASSFAGVSFAGFSFGFLRLGFLLHLMEDQTSPAHASNASHGHKPLRVDLFAHLDPDLKGKTVDFGFPDPMEVTIDGKDANRDIPRSAWPPRDTRQLIDMPAADILKSMHNFTSTRYTRESMKARTTRMMANVKKRVESRLPDLVKDLKMPWPLGKETAAHEIQRLKREVATIVHQEMEKEAAAEMKATLQKTADANQEWLVLGPEAVRHSASLLWKFITEARRIGGPQAPAMPGCTLAP